MTGAQQGTKPDSPRPAHALLMSDRPGDWGLQAFWRVLGNQKPLSFPLNKYRNRTGLATGRALVRAVASGVRAALETPPRDAGLLSSVRAGKAAGQPCCKCQLEVCREDGLAGG